MAIVVRSSFFFSSSPYVYTYPLAIPPHNLSITHYGKHGNDLMRSCCPCVRRSNDVYSYLPRLTSLYGYEDGTALANRRLGYQVTRASKQAHNGEEKFDTAKGYTQEEQRWLREEQRWLREEQRWIREEARWNAERDSLMNQVTDLTLKIQDLESELESLSNRVGSNETVPVTLNKIASLLQVLNSYTARISSTTPIQSQISEYGLEDTGSETEIIEKITPIAPDFAPTLTPISDLESKDKANHEQKQQRSSRLSLRMGSEGEEVQSLQEALMSLGFYSGEEDMEFSSFSDGTLRAVKTWQASIGVSEDGVMTSELLEMLYGTPKADKFGSSVNGDQDMTFTKQDEANGAAFMAREVEETVMKKEPDDVEVTQPRVYLLGENRWEEPSRLTKKNDKVNGDNSRASATKCLACRGEGRLLCMECDGTGEPNVEPQFMEWVEEGSKCPYCNGLGYTVCDLCEGKAATA